MPKRFVTVGAIIGSTLMALSLVGSSRNPANLSRLPNKTSLLEVVRLRDLGKSAFLDGRYQDAREAYRAAAAAAIHAGSAFEAAGNWSAAGTASAMALQYRPALEDLSRARGIAEASGEMVPLIWALNSLASLFLQMGAPENALGISRAALAGPAGHADAKMRARLFYEEAQALATLGRFREAEPIFRQALAQSVDAGDL